jgi:hypothetical protein
MPTLLISLSFCSSFSPSVSVLFVSTSTFLSFISIFSLFFFLRLLFLFSFYFALSIKILYTFPLFFPCFFFLKAFLFLCSSNTCLIFLMVSALFFIRPSIFLSSFLPFSLSLLFYFCTFVF